MSESINRQWLLTRRPKGAFNLEDVSLQEAAIPTPAAGQILVRNLCLSCEPAQLGWMTSETYFPAMALGEVVRSLAAGRVIESHHPRFAPGQLVQGLFGFQDYAVLAGDGGLYPILPMPEHVPLENAMSVLGNTGLTAYFGLFEIGRPEVGQTVVVSAAAGATGSMVGQLALSRGCRVIGIAGGAEKCRYLTEQLGFTAAIDYKSENLVTRLRQTCPQGIDVYFDNVGGRVLDAALLFLARRGRVVICGAMSSYTERLPPPGPRNYFRLLKQRGRMEGFVVIDYLHRADEALAALTALWQQGRLRDRIDVVEGLEHAPAALMRLFAGENQGKQLVRIAV